MNREEYISILETDNVSYKKENKQLQSNWNSLFDYAKEQLEKAWDKVEQDTWEEILDKMNELEGVDNENN